VITQVLQPTCTSDEVAWGFGPWLWFRWLHRLNRTSDADRPRHLRLGSRRPEQGEPMAKKKKKDKKKKGKKGKKK
jgi:hypothetical protein